MPFLQIQAHCLEESKVIEQTWLVLLCMKPGDYSVPPTGVYELFNGKGGIRHYWRDVTQGVLNLSFVLTNEWLKVAYDLADYPGEGNSERDNFVKACREAANKYPLNDADGIVVYTHRDVDLWGDPGIVVCSHDHDPQRDCP